MPTQNKHNILYIGPYREFSGAGNAARNYIQALHRSGHELCIAPVYSIGDIYPENEISSEILPLEHNFLKNYDIVIQHCHPFDYVQDARFDKHIGIFQFNSQNIPHALNSRLDLMDKIVVNSQTNNKILSKIITDQNKVIVVPELIDTNLVNQSYFEYEWLQKNKDYVFYMVGDFIDRKNFLKVISAYICTFNKHDNVHLVIKTKPHHSHNNPEILYKQIDYEISKIYDANRTTKEKSPNIKIMVGKFDYAKLLNLHYNGNCYIDASKGENFGYPVLEASLFNKDVIVNSRISSSEIPSNAHLVPANICSISDPYTKSFIDNNTTDLWADIDYGGLCDTMKLAWLNRYESKPTNDMKKYDLSNIEQLLC